MARLNEMIRSRRKELGLTLLQLAEKTGVREATVQRWESGNIKTIKYETMELLAHALNCTPQYLMGWEEEKTPAPESGLVFIDIGSVITPPRQKCAYTRF